MNYMKRSYIVLIGIICAIPVLSLAQTIVPTTPLTYSTPHYVSEFVPNKQPVFYLAEQLNINSTDPLFGMYNTPAGVYESSIKGGDLYTQNDKNKPIRDGIANVVGFVLVKQASRIDFQLQYIDSTTGTIYAPGTMISYVAPPGRTIASDDPVPFVIGPIPNVHRDDSFMIVNPLTGVRYFGPVKFGTLGDPASLRDAMEEWFYYVQTYKPRTDSRWYVTLAECEAARQKEFGDPKPCYSTFRRAISVMWVQGPRPDNGPYTIISKTGIKLVFSVDTRGLTQDFRLLYRARDQAATMRAIAVDPGKTLRTDLGKRADLEFEITGLTPEKHYDFWLIDGAGYDPANPNATSMGSVDTDQNTWQDQISNRHIFFKGDFWPTDKALFKTTPPDISNLTANLSLPGMPSLGTVSTTEGVTPLVPCGIDGTRGYPVDKSLSKADTFMDVNGNGIIEGADPNGATDGDTIIGDLNKNGKIDPDISLGEYTDSNGLSGLQIQEWKETNGIPGFQSRGELCDFNDTIELVRRGLKYIYVIVPTLAAIMIGYAGFLFLTSNENPARRTEAKKVLKGTIIGIVIILAAWLIVANVMVLIGFNSSWTWLKI